MSKECKCEKKGFKVEDKRGMPKEESEPDTAAETATEPVPETDTEPTPEPAPAPDFPINFSTFVLSLAANTNIHLGLTPNPITGKQEVELIPAKQTIDILDMLQEKTKNNLAKEDVHLLEGLLYDLRMKYVEIKKKQEQATGAGSVSESGSGQGQTQGPKPESDEAG